MSVNFDFYRTFYYVGKYKNITAAAKALFVTQPTVTHAIQALERELNCSLFIRSQKGRFLYTGRRRLLPPDCGRLRNDFRSGTKPRSCKKSFRRSYRYRRPVKQHCIIILCQSWQISAETIPASA